MVSNKNHLKRIAQRYIVYRYYIVTILIRVPVKDLNPSYNHLEFFTHLANEILCNIFLLVDNFNILVFNIPFDFGS